MAKEERRDDLVEIETAEIGVEIEEVVVEEEIEEVVVQAAAEIEEDK